MTEHRKKGCVCGKIGSHDCKIVKHGDKRAAWKYSHEDLLRIRRGLPAKKKEEE